MYCYKLLYALFLFCYSITCLLKYIIFSFPCVCVYKKYILYSIVFSVQSVCTSRLECRFGWDTHWLKVLTKMCMGKHPSCCSMRFFFVCISLFFTRAVAWFAIRLLFAYLLEYVTITQHVVIIHMHYLFRCIKISIHLLRSTRTKVSEKQSKRCSSAKCNNSNNNSAVCVCFCSLYLSPFEQPSCKTNKTETIMQQLSGWLRFLFCLPIKKKRFLHWRNFLDQVFLR